MDPTIVAGFPVKRCFIGREGNLYSSYRHTVTVRLRGPNRIVWKQRNSLVRTASANSHRRHFGFSLSVACSSGATPHLEGAASSRLVATISSSTPPIPWRVPPKDVVTGALVAIVISALAVICALVVKALQEMILACQSATRASLEVELAAKSLVKACVAVDNICDVVDRNLSRVDNFSEQASESFTDIAESFTKDMSTASLTLRQIMMNREDDSCPTEGPCLGAPVPGIKIGFLGWIPKGKTGPRLSFSKRNTFLTGECVGVPQEVYRGASREYTWGIVDFHPGDESSDTILSCEWPPTKSFEENITTVQVEDTYRVIVSLDGDVAAYRTLKAREIGKYASSIVNVKNSMLPV